MEIGDAIALSRLIEYLYTGDYSDDNNDTIPVSQVSGNERLHDVNLSSTIMPTHQEASHSQRYFLTCVICFL